MKHYWLLPLIFFLTLSLFSQEKKNLEVTRISNPPKIDGLLDDSIWNSLPAYGNFNMYQPGNDGEVSEAYRTEVKMAYDDKAVYVAAICTIPIQKKY